MLNKIKQFSIRHFLKTAPFDSVECLLCAGENIDTLLRRRDAVLRLRNSLNDKIRYLEHRCKSSITRYLDEVEQVLPISVLRENAPWLSTELPECAIPGMITEEEAQYYIWLGSYYSGCGEVIELGPWLGRSTMHILEGLQRSGHFAEKKLHVFDDFVWRSSFMNAYVTPDLQMGDDSNFLPLFHKMTAARGEQIEACAVAIQRQSWNGHLPLLSWDDKPIEIVYVDCGKAFLENEAWFRILSPYFVADNTLVVMQDWRAHRKTPRKPYTGIWHFTESKGRSLEQVHETKGGDIATFLWKGESDLHRNR